MDLQALCDGSYEEALTFIETAAAAPEGLVKAAEGILDTLKGWGNQAVDWTKGQYNDIVNSEAGRNVGTWWNDLPDPARLGITGAGIGAGIGGLGSLAFGPRRRKNPGYGALIGGLLGGAGMGAYGLMRNGTPPMGESPSEKLTVVDKNRQEQVEKIKRLNEAQQNPESFWNAFKGSVNDGNYGTAAQIIDPGVSHILHSDGGLLPKNNIPVPFTGGKGIDMPTTTNRSGLDTFIGGLTADTIGSKMRRFRPTDADVRLGLQTDGVDQKLPLALKGRAADIIGQKEHANLGLMNPLRRTPPILSGSLLSKHPGLDVVTDMTPPIPPPVGPATPTTVPGSGIKLPTPAAPPPIPPTPVTTHLTPDHLRAIGQHGQDSRSFWSSAKGRFAGTPIPRTIAHPALQLANKFVNGMPHQTALEQKTLTDLDAQHHALTAALPKDQIGPVVAKMNAGDRSKFYGYLAAQKPEVQAPIASSLHPADQQLYRAQFPAKPPIAGGH